MAIFTDATEKTLAYATPGEPYEIEIMPMSQGLRVVVPREGNLAYVASPGSQLVAVVTIIVGAFITMRLLRPFLPNVHSPFLVLVAAVPTIAIQMIVKSLLRRGRCGQPLVITIMSDEVLIDHPGLLKRRRTLRRNGIKDVSLVNPDRGKASARFTRFVRMTIADGDASNSCRTITFCRARDELEQARVVTALRRALGLPADTAYLDLLKSV
jgi:hypothetical protein